MPIPCTSTFCTCSTFCEGSAFTKSHSKSRAKLPKRFRLPEQVLANLDLDHAQAPALSASPEMASVDSLWWRACDSCWRRGCGHETGSAANKFCAASSGNCRGNHSGSTDADAPAGRDSGSAAAFAPGRQTRVCRGKACPAATAKNDGEGRPGEIHGRSEEHTSELQSRFGISYAV